MQEKRTQGASAAETVNAEVAQLVKRLRKESGLTQQDLAREIGTTQSVISRLEDPSYSGHSLSMLLRIARALNCRLKVLMSEASQSDAGRKPSFSLKEHQRLMRLPAEERLRVYNARTGKP